LELSGACSSWSQRVKRALFLFTCSVESSWRDLLGLLRSSYNPTDRWCHVWSCRQIGGAMFGAVRSLQQLVTESQKSIVSLPLCSAESSWRDLLGLLRSSYNPTDRWCHVWSCQEPAAVGHRESKEHCFSSPLFCMKKVHGETYLVC
jgi:hypothetical protein